METPYLKELECKRSAVSFENRRLESEYRAYTSRRSELNVRRQLALGAAVLVGVTGLDFALQSHEFALHAMWLRALFSVPPIGFALSLTFVRRDLWLRQVAGVLTVFGVGLASLSISDGPSSSEHAALAGGFMIVVFTYFFLGLHYVFARAAGFALVPAYVLLGLFEGTSATTLVYGSYNLLIVNLICAIGAGQLELARRRDFLKERLLSHRAAHDSLSELSNRRAFDTHLAESWQSARKTGASLALFLIDIDHFKKYNDHYGHQAGDHAIQRVGRILKEVLRRPTDFASRYGGEEFAAIVPDIDQASATLLGERIRERVLIENIEHVESAASVVTVSIGVAQLHPQLSDRSEKGFVQMADQALYAAKASGRNRVVNAGAASTDKTGVFEVINPAGV